MIRLVSLVALIIFFAPQPVAADDVNSLVAECDKLFDRDAPYEVQIAKAMEIRNLVAAREDDELTARGVIRMLLIEIHTGKWSEGWKSLRDDSIELTEGLGKRSVARIEVQAFHGYLKAMYFKQVKGGVADLRASIAVAISLELDALLTRAHYLLGRVAIFDEQELNSLESLRLSIRFARHSKNEWAAF